MHIYMLARQSGSDLIRGPGRIDVSGASWALVSPRSQSSFPWWRKNEDMNIYWCIPRIYAYWHKFYDNESMYWCHHMNLGVIQKSLQSNIHTQVAVEGGVWGYPPAERNEDIQGIVIWHLAWPTDGCLWEEPSREVGSPGSRHKCLGSGWPCILSRSCDVYMMSYQDGQMHFARWSTMGQNNISGNIYKWIHMGDVPVLELCIDDEY